MKTIKEWAIDILVALKKIHIAQMPLFYKSLTGSNIFIEPKTKQLKIVVPSIMMKKAGPN